jgi:hypothetical protein
MNAGQPAKRSNMQENPGFHFTPRSVEVRGTVKHVPQGGTMLGPGLAADILRIFPTYLMSMGQGGNGASAGPSADAGRPGSQEKNERGGMEWSWTMIPQGCWIK